MMQLQALCNVSIMLNCVQKKKTYQRISHFCFLVTSHNADTEQDIVYLEHNEKMCKLSKCVHASYWTWYKI